MPSLIDHARDPGQPPADRRIRPHGRYREVRAQAARAAADAFEAR